MASAPVRPPGDGTDPDANSARRPRIDEADYNLASNVYDRDAASRTGRAPRRSYMNRVVSSQEGMSSASNLASRVYGTPSELRAANAPTALEDRARAAPSNGAATTLEVAPASPPSVPGRPPGSSRFSIRTFDSLSVVPFRWFLLAMLGQFSAMNMQQLARGYLVFELTGSFSALGLMSLANAIPMFVFSPWGGVLADRMSRKLVLQVGQALNAGIAGSIAVLLFLGVLRFEHLMASAAVQGFVWALMMPARQAMIPDVVGEERLMNAVALNTAGMNVMRLAAPGIGGLLIAAVGAEWAYVFMTGGFLLAVVALWPVPGKARSLTPIARAGDRPRRGATRESFSDLAEGIRYIRAHPNVLAILGVNFAIVLFSMPYMMLLPGFVAEVLDGGPDKLGLLMTITGAGSVVGSLAIASMPSRRRGLVLLLSSVLLGVALIGFSVSTSFIVTAVLMVFIGLGQTGRMSLSNVLLQAYVEDQYRGRVMSVYMMEFGIVSFGVFGVGILAALIGVQWAIGATAVALTITSLVALLYPRIRDLD